MPNNRLPTPLIVDLVAVPGGIDDVELEADAVLDDDCPRKDPITSATRARRQENDSISTIFCLQLAGLSEEE